MVWCINIIFCVMLHSNVMMKNAIYFVFVQLLLLLLLGVYGDLKLESLFEKTN